MAEQQFDIKVDYAIRLNGKFLRASKIRPELFKAVLFQAQTAIESTLDKQYQKNVVRSPNVQRGSILAILLHSDETKPLSTQGMYARENQQYNRGTYFNQDDLTPKYQSYWQAVNKVGLIPQARQIGWEPTLSMRGLFLEVRDTPFELIPDIDTEAERLGYTEDEAQKTLYKQIIDLDFAGRSDEAKDLFREYMDLAFANTSKLPNGPVYTKAQIGLFIQRAKLFKKMGYFDECLESLDDALYIAEGHKFSDVADRIKSIIKDVEIEVEGRIKRGE